MCTRCIIDVLGCARVLSCRSETRCCFVLVAVIVDLPSFSDHPAGVQLCAAPTGRAFAWLPHRSRPRSRRSSSSRRHFGAGSSKEVRRRRGVRERARACFNPAHGERANERTTDEACANIRVRAYVVPMRIPYDVSISAV